MRFFAFSGHFNPKTKKVGQIDALLLAEPQDTGTLLRMWLGQKEENDPIRFLNRENI